MNGPLFWLYNIYILTTFTHFISNSYIQYAQPIANNLFLKKVFVAGRSNVFFFFCCRSNYLRYRHETQSSYPLFLSSGQLLPFIRALFEGSFQQSLYEHRYQVDGVLCDSLFASFSDSIFEHQYYGANLVYKRHPFYH